MPVTKTTGITVQCFLPPKIEIVSISSKVTKRDPKTLNVKIQYQEQSRYSAMHGSKNTEQQSCRGDNFP